MSHRIPTVVESKLNFLKLTKTGKENLTVFSDKIIFKALSLFQRSYDTIPDNPYNTFYAACLQETKRLLVKPNFTILRDYPSYNPDSDMTEHGEKFDIDKCRTIKVCCRTNKDLFPKKKGSSFTFYKGPTFNQGVQYYKYGQWYPYPDQAIDDHTAPTQPGKETKTFQHAYRDPIDNPVEPFEELKKAIRSGNINKKGLNFLRKAYIKHQPELVKIIDAYLTAELYDPKKTVQHAQTESSTEDI